MPHHRLHRLVCSLGRRLVPIFTSRACQIGSRGRCGRGTSAGIRQPYTAMEDVVTAHFDYARLDEADSPIRIRLNSTAVKVRHLGTPEDSRKVAVIYVRGGAARQVRARRCVLACYHSIIPRLCPELPERQRVALADGVKVPLVYANILIRDWTSFQRLGISHIYGPTTYFSSIDLDFPVTIGEYRNPAHADRADGPSSPAGAVPAGPPEAKSEQGGSIRAPGDHVRDVRAPDPGAIGTGALGGGFDPARDIEEITVNRWPHGYADESDPMVDPDWPTEEDKPWVIARKRFGHIAIANSDAARRAYTDAAIDQAHREVQELLKSNLN